MNRPAGRLKQIIIVVVVIKINKGVNMKRYEYNFNTLEGIKIIHLKGKGIKQAIKVFNAPFLSVKYLNKNNKVITKIN